MIFGDLLYPVCHHIWQHLKFEWYLWKYGNAYIRDGWAMHRGLEPPEQITEVIVSETAGWSGYIQGGEAMAFNTPLSQEEIQRVQSFLSERWGLVTDSLENFSMAATQTAEAMQTFSQCMVERSDVTIASQAVKAKTVIDLSELCVKDENGQPLVCYGCAHSRADSSFPGKPSGERPCGFCVRNKNRDQMIQNAGYPEWYGGDPALKNPMDCYHSIDMHDQVKLWIGQAKYAGKRRIKL